MNAQTTGSTYSSDKRGLVSLHAKPIRNQMVFAWHACSTVTELNRSRAQYPGWPTGNNRKGPAVLYEVAKGLLANCMWSTVALSYDIH